MSVKGSPEPARAPSSRAHGKCDDIRRFVGWLLLLPSVRQQGVEIAGAAEGGGADVDVENWRRGDGSNRGSIIGGWCEDGRVVSEVEEEVGGGGVVEDAGDGVGVAFIGFLFV